MPNEPTTSTPTAAEATTSAAAQHADTTADASQPATPATTDAPADGAGAGEAQPASAAAQHADTPENPAPAEQPADIDLAAATDDDYAKAAIPDVDGQDEPPDRTLVTAMAKGLRDAGIQPSVIAKIAPVYAKAIQEADAAATAARETRMKELTAKCNAEVTEGEWKDFAAAYKDHIAGDPFLKDIVDHTELGSSPAFVKLIALAGATLRVETQPPASATAGSGQSDLDRRVFEQTVPKHLR